MSTLTVVPKKKAKEKDLTDREVIEAAAGASMEACDLIGEPTCNECREAHPPDGTTLFGLLHIILARLDDIEARLQ